MVAVPALRKEAARSAPVSVVRTLPFGFGLLRALLRPASRTALVKQQAPTACRQALTLIDASSTSAAEDFWQVSGARSLGTRCVVPREWAHRAPAAYGAQTEREAVWATEQALADDNVSTVALWLPSQRPAATWSRQRLLRRLGAVADRRCKRLVVAMHSA